jgi:hypothetical protein
MLAQAERLTISWLDYLLSCGLCVQPERPSKRTWIDPTYCNSEGQRSGKDE